MKKFYSLRIITLITSFLPRPLKSIVGLSLIIVLTFSQGMVTLSAQIWTQPGINIDGEALEDWSGYSISRSPDGLRLAVGAFANDGGGTDAGQLRVYAESGGVVQTGDLLLVPCSLLLTSS